MMPSSIACLWAANMSKASMFRRKLPRAACSFRPVTARAFAD